MANLQYAFVMIPYFDILKPFLSRAENTYKSYMSAPVSEYVRLQWNLAHKGFPCFHRLWIDGRLTYSVSTYVNDV